MTTIAEKKTGSYRVALDCSDRGEWSLLVAYVGMWASGEVVTVDLESGAEIDGMPTDFAAWFASEVTGDHAVEAFLAIARFDRYTNESPGGHGAVMVRAAMTRARIAALANFGARAARAGAPTIGVDASRETLIAWLQWNDPNGCHTDDRARSEGFDPYDLDRAWEALADMVKEDLSAYAKEHGA